ncbi:alpha/beta hydrolase [Gloeobacter violaceus]|uniref:Gll3761 protein n=1 Tax=Gloeobacter violaceus (strain ATCC 29082 / PCC 7421) TaxID=251221 RepID=Q7NEW7_GLOVI|nr:carboxylesterase [Gloeobacter violaceus]BAC91702.1 gll3761 [Gloeobacter violaceus PCC 7421]
MLKCDTLEASCGAPQATVFMLHGRGADCTDLVPLAEALELPGVRYCFPNAPFGVEGYSPGSQWYAFGPKHAEGVAQSAVLLKALVEREREACPQLPYAFMGFSQGAVMALGAGLLFEPPPAAIVALSGYLFEPEALWAKRPRDLAPPAVLIAHGSQDPIIPVRAGQAAAAALAGKGFPVQYHEFAMGHQINQAEIELVRDFLQHTLGLRAGKIQ